MDKEKRSNKTANSKKKKGVLKIPYHRKPENLSLDEWQVALRKQFAETQQFGIENLGTCSVFSDFSISNPKSKTSYKVSIRGEQPGWNFCSCMDFKTNLLGTCKHIEFVLFNIRKKSANRKILKAGYKPFYTSVYLSYQKERAVKIRIGSECKKEFELLAAEYFDKENNLLPNAWQHFDVFLQKAYAIHVNFRCYQDALTFILDKRETYERNKTIDKALNKKEAFFKTLMSAQLFPYQQEGVEFAMRKGRCLIADDMGLGKTIQAIGAAEGMKKLFHISSVLIVCPTSLKYQWKSEIEKFTDSNFHVIEGGKWERNKQYKNDSFYNICSYNIVGNDIEEINAAEYDLVILDEAQRIKNWQTQTAKNVKRLQSKYCIVLTGTPLENKIEELYSVVQMIDPLLLGALFRFVAMHQIMDEESGKVLGYKDLNKISDILKDVLLRRHKRNVLRQLPDRIDKNLFVPMTEAQMVYYSEANDIVVKLVHKWRRFKFLNEADRQKLLINLNVMRMACNSTFVIDQQTRHDTKIEELLNILTEAFENGTEKVVVFSQWERMTRIVAQELELRNIGYEHLHGGVASKNREILFENFKHKAESKVFLSTDAGGVGLNLQSASLLINLDLPWNPAVLEQRIARIYRMGQKRNVQVINLIAQDTIEHQMLSKLKFKSAVAAGILDNGESAVFIGESKLNELMKQVESLTATTSTPPLNVEEDIVQNEAVKKESASQKEDKLSKPQSETEKQLLLFEGENGSDKTVKQDIEATAHTQDLIATAADFFGKLTQTLADKERAQKLVRELVQQDEAGNSYLKIPIKDKNIVENGLKLITQLLLSAK